MGGSSYYKAGSAFSFDPGLMYAQWTDYDLQDGDIILRKGRSMVSDLIARSFENSRRMSHCGIILNSAGGYEVVHTISGSISEQDGIRKDTLQDFVLGADKANVYILRSRNIRNQRLIRDNVTQLLSQNPPFDHNFDLEDSSRLYCTEMIRKVFLDAGEEDFFDQIKIYGMTLLDFGSFFDDTRFQILYPGQGTMNQRETMANANDLY